MLLLIILNIYLSQQFFSAGDLKQRQNHLRLVLNFPVQTFAVNFKTETTSSYFKPGKRYRSRKFEFITSIKSESSFADTTDMICRGGNVFWPQMAQAPPFSIKCARHHRFLATRDDHISTGSRGNYTQKPSSDFAEIMVTHLWNFSGMKRLNRMIDSVDWNFYRSVYRIYCDIWDTNCLGLECLARIITKR